MEIDLTGMCLLARASFQRSGHASHDCYTHGDEVTEKNDRNKANIDELTSPNAHGRACKLAQRLTQVGIFLALTWPGFFLSTFLGSRISAPAMYMLANACLAGCEDE